MTLDIHNTDKLGLFRQEMERAGIKLLPPDINLSQPWFSVEHMGGGRRGARASLPYAMRCRPCAMSGWVPRKR